LAVNLTGILIVCQNKRCTVCGHSLWLAYRIGVVEQCCQRV